MSEKTPGQAAYEAFTAVRYDGSLTTAWTSPTIAHKAWEAAARAATAPVTAPLEALAARWEARHLEYRNAAHSAESPDYGRAQYAIGVAYRKCAEQLRAAIAGDEDGSAASSAIHSPVPPPSPPSASSTTSTPATPNGSSSREPRATGAGNDV